MSTRDNPAETSHTQDPRVNQDLTRNQDTAISWGWGEHKVAAAASSQSPLSPMLGSTESHTLSPPPTQSPTSHILSIPPTSVSHFHSLPSDTDYIVTSDKVGFPAFCFVKSLDLCGSSSTYRLIYLNIWSLVGRTAWDH